MRSSIFTGSRDQNFRQSYRPLLFNIDDTPVGDTPNEETKAELVALEKTLEGDGMAALQEAMMPDNGMSYYLVRPIQSWLALDTLIQNLEITDFALKHLQSIFDKPFFEDNRALEMLDTWERIPYTFEADGMPPFLGTLSKAISNDAKCIFVKKWPAYCTALMRTEWARQEVGLKRKLNQLCGDNLLKEADEDPWQWSCAFEELLRASQDDELTSTGKASDVVLDELHRHKQRLVAGLIHYRSSVQVQIGKAQSIRVTLLAVGTSFAFAAWSWLLNAYL